MNKNEAYRSELEGLRAIAVGLVIFYHLGLDAFKFGYLGVDIFFILSGYLISLLLSSHEKPINFTEFFARRILRIYPALLVMVILTFCLFWAVIDLSQMREVSGAAAFSVVSLANVFFSRRSGYFDLAAEQNPLIHTWSLSLEIQFYLFACVFFLVASKWSNGLRNVVIASTCVASVVAAIVVESISEIAAFYLLPFRLWEFLFGSFIFFLRSSAETKYSSWQSFVFCLLASIAIFWDSPIFEIPFFREIVLSIAMGSFLFAHDGGLINRFLASKIMVALGGLSYCLYLFHQPLVVFSDIVFDSLPTKVIFVLLAGSTVSMIVHKFVESPFRQRKGIDIKQRLYYCAGISIAVLALGLSGFVSNGFEMFRSHLLPANQGLLIEAARKQRSVSILAGECHFDGKTGRTSISDFLKEWDCLEGSHGQTVFFVGDSHAADRAASFRQFGAKPGQLTASGCPLVPSRVKRATRHCRPLLHRAREIAMADNVTTIFLTSELSDGFSQAYLSDILKYWTELGKPVFLWSPMPSYEDQLAAWKIGLTKPRHPNISLRNDFYTVISYSTLPQNLTIVNTSKYLCAEPDLLGRCLMFFEDRILLTDENHWSPDGGAEFGARIIADSQFAELF